MSLWTDEEAYQYLNSHYYMDQMTQEKQDKLMTGLHAMEHRPWCRTNLVHVFPNYGADCTCDAKYHEVGPGMLMIENN